MEVIAQAFDCKKDGDNVVIITADYNEEGNRVLTENHIPNKRAFQIWKQLGICLMTPRLPHTYYVLRVEINGRLIAERMSMDNAFIDDEIKALKELYTKYEGAVFYYGVLSAI